jgi:mono/diheme cytochrome c family protein
VLKGANRPDVILKAIADNKGGMNVFKDAIQGPQAADIAAYLQTAK